MKLYDFICDRHAPRGTILVSHGYAEHHRRYLSFIQRLNDAGYDVFTYDHPGHGTSPGPRARVDVGKLIHDHQEVRLNVLQHSRTPDMFVFGHSMGGLVTAASALIDPSHLLGMILTGPAFKPYGLIPTRTIRLLAPLVCRIPGLPAVKSLTGLASRDPNVVKDFESDPLSFHGHVPGMTGTTITLQGDETLRRSHHLAVPTIIFHGNRDHITDIGSSQQFIAQSGLPDAHLRIIDGAYHNILDEPEGPGIMDDIIIWMDARR